MALEAMTWQLNRKANTLANPLSAQGAANVWNGSTGGRSWDRSPVPHPHDRIGFYGTGVYGS